MKLYLTSGTADFMESLRKKRANEQIIIMHGEGNTVLLHETEGKSVFATPRTFEVLDAVNDLQQKGYFVMNNIPVSEEGRALFEQRFANRAGNVDEASGFIAYRLLRPVKHETYIVLTQWAGPASFELWQSSDAFKEAHTQRRESSTGMANTQAMFMSKPYLTKYTAKPLED